MGQIENTAVNELIAHASGGPRATPSAGMPAMTASEPSHALPVMPVAAPFEPRAALPTHPAAVSSAPPAGPTWTLPFSAAAVQPAWHAGGTAWPQQIDPRQLYALSQIEHSNQRLVPTFQMRRRKSEVHTVVGRLVFPVALLVSIGLVVGAYVAFGGDHHQALSAAAALRDPSSAPAGISHAAMPSPGVDPTSAPAEPAAAAEAPAAAAEPAPAEPAPAEPAPAPAPAELAAPAVEAAPMEAAPAAVIADRAPTVAAPTAAAAATRASAVPVLVDVRIESVPSGAEVTLVDRGRAQLVGNTPIDTALDPSREYDLVLTVENRPPHVEHIDPRTTRRVAVTLGKRARPAGRAPRRQR